MIGIAIQLHEQTIQKPPPEPPVEEKLYLMCEICFEPIAQIDVNRLKYPLMGHMFSDPKPERKYGNPFHADSPWEDMRCPWCNFRPFIKRDKIKTQNGYINLTRGETHAD